MAIRFREHDDGYYVHFGDVASWLSGYGDTLEANRKKEGEAAIRNTVAGLLLCRLQIDLRKPS